MAERTPKLLRRGSAFDPGAGLLRAEHFQMAYATNDIERAQDLFSSRLGIREFCRMEGPNAAGGQIRVELAWVGTIMYELISASGPGSEIFMGRLPDGDDFKLRHHHLGYLVHDQSQWDALEAEAARAGLPIVWKSVNAGFMTSCFVDVPELGHYLEFLMPEPAGLEFFENVPRN
jgi:hypothetical protein